MSSSARIETRIGPDYSFQDRLVAECWKHLDGPARRCLLAAGCGAGKTNMALKLLVRHYRKYGQKILVLAHGDTENRSGLYEALSKSKAVKCVEVTPRTKASELVEADVHIAIPQGYRRLKGQAYGLLVQDEAHRFYLQTMTQTILSWNPDIPQLLVTGSHGHFTRTQWGPTAYFSQLEMLDAGIILNPEIYLFPTKQEFRAFNAEGDLSKEEVLTNLDAITAHVLERAVGKTLVACHNVKAARELSMKLREKGAKVSLSTAEDDVTSFALRRFKEKAEVQFLIVVYRCVIGFNMPALQTVFDLTASKNLDRLFQLMGRVIRTDPRNAEKQPRYIKLVPEIQYEHYQRVMTAVTWLAHTETYRAFDGTLDGIRVPVPKVSLTRKPLASSDRRELPKYEPLPTNYYTLNAEWDRVEDSSGEYVFTTLRKQIQLLNGINRDSEGAKAWIQTFVLRTGGFPAERSKDPEEARHGWLFQKYICRTGGCFDPIFHQWCLGHGWIPQSEKAEKCLREAYAFSQKSGWLPSADSKDPNERGLGQRISGYSNRNSPGFAEYVAKYPNLRTYQRKQDWGNFYSYLRSNLSFPRRSSEGSEERRLADNASNWRKRHPEFTAECDRIAKELGIPKPVQGGQPKQKEKKT